MGACGLKKLLEIYNENEAKLTKIPYSFPGLLQPVSKKTGQKSEKTGHRISKKKKKSSILR